MLRCHRSQSGRLQFHVRTDLPAFEEITLPEEMGLMSASHFCSLFCRKSQGAMTLFLAM